MNVYPLTLRGARGIIAPHWLQALLLVCCILLKCASPGASADARVAAGSLATYGAGIAARQ